MGVRRYIGWSISLVAASVAMSVPSGVGAATVVNGSFESGTLSGWNVHRVTQLGNWFAYKGTDAPIGKKRKPTPAAPVQPPPQGAFAAIADQVNPDTLILYQDIALEAGVDHWLSLIAYYDSYKPIAVPVPNTLSVSDDVLGQKPNQQFRIDVIEPDAPIESVESADILRTLFQTEPEDPANVKPNEPVRMPPTRLTVDLSSFAGQTVRLRIVSATHEEVLNAGVDAVSIANVPPSSSRGSRAGGPRLFSFGRIRSNRHNGIATLRVRVSGPGLVRAKGVRTRAGASLAAKTGRPRKSIEPVTVPVARAKTVAIRLRPTPRARAILRAGRRLQVEVAVTYMPATGFPETATVPVVLELERRSRHRR